VDRVGTRPSRGIEHEVDAQVGVARRVAGEAYGVVGLADVRQGGVGVGVDRDGLDAERTAGAEDPRGDLGAVGDEESTDHDSHLTGFRRARRDLVPRSRGLLNLVSLTRRARSSHAAARLITA